MHCIGCGNQAAQVDLLAHGLDAGRPGAQCTRNVDATASQIDAIECIDLALDRNPAITNWDGAIQDAANGSAIGNTVCIEHAIDEFACGGLQRKGTSINRAIWPDNYSVRVQ